MELLLELRDDLLGLAARAAHHGRALLARLTDELALALVEVVAGLLHPGLQLLHAQLPLENVGVSLLVHHLLLFQLV